MVRFYIVFITIIYRRLEKRLERYLKLQEVRTERSAVAVLCVLFSVFCIIINQKGQGDH